MSIQPWQQLVLDNIKLPYWIAARAFRKEPYTTDREDLEQEGLIGLIKAAKAYAPERCHGGFQAYASVCILNEIRGRLLVDRKHTTNRSWIKTPEQLCEDKAVVEQRDMVQRLLTFCNARQREAIRRRYFEHQKLREIGQSMGLSKQRAKRLLDSGLSRISHAATTSAT